MKAGKLVALGILAGGGLYWFAKRNPGVLDAYLPLSADARAAQQRANMTSNVGNAPAVPAPSFFGSAPGVAAIDSAIIGTVGLLANAGIFGAGAVAGAATLGIGLAVAFFSYEFLKQRASMHVNDLRDAWTEQFIALHQALEIRALTTDQTRGSGPGSLEMAEVIFFFDHDSTQRLWMAVTHTQDEQQFRAAARQVDLFLTAQGVPVQDVT